MAAAIAVAYYGRDNCSTSQSAAAASMANVTKAILFMAALGGGLYPVHRCSAKGMSTLVGVALGFYEGVVNSLTTTRVADMLQVFFELRDRLITFLLFVR